MGLDFFHQVLVAFLDKIINEFFLKMDLRFASANSGGGAPPDCGLSLEDGIIGSDGITILL